MRARLPLLSPRRSRASSLSLTIVLSVIMTALIAALALTAGSESQAISGLSKQDQAFYTAESGIQVVVWHMKNKQMSNFKPANDGSGSTTSTLSTGTYTVSWDAPLGGTYKLKASASSSAGNASYSLSATASMPGSGLPLIATAGDLLTKNAIIKRDVLVGGSYSNGSSGTLDGYLYLGSGGTYKGATANQVIPNTPWQDLSFAPLYKAPAAPVGKTSFAFDTDGDANKEVHYVGDLTNPTLVGSGTLFVEGNVTFDNGTDIGSSTKPVYIVATGNINFSKQTTVYGGIYTTATFTRAKIYLYGYLYVANIAQTNFGNAIFYDATTTDRPWFDDRIGIGTSNSTSVTLANVTGPQP